MCSIIGFTSDAIPPEEFRPFFDRTVSRGPDMTRVEKAGPGYLCACATANSISSDR